MSSPIQTPNKPFIKILWEIHFFPSISPTTEKVKLPQLPKELANAQQSLFLPPSMANPEDMQSLLKLMTLFHKTSGKLVEDLLAQAKSLKEFTEKDAEQNFEIAKMIGWIKLLQQLFDKLKDDIT